MKKIYAAVVFILFFDLLKAQDIEWQNTIGGSDNESLRSIQQTVDGGYILGGYSDSNISGDKTENCIGVIGLSDYWIIKTDATGNIQWQNTIGGSGTERLYSLQQTTDGGYILGGYSDSNTSGDKTENSNGIWDYWIVKTDTSGSIQWQNTIGGSGGDYLESIQETIDGGYILGGHSDSNISGDKTENSNGALDYWIVKIDSSGNVQWQNTIGGDSVEFLHSIMQSIDGGFILGGSSRSSISGDKTENNMGSLITFDFWIIKTDSIGNIQWQNTIGGTGNDNLQSIQQTTDGGYILCGYSNSDITGDKTENCIGGDDYWIVKIDASGNIEWQNTIGGSDTDQGSFIQQTSDGGYILGGLSESNISGDKAENCIGGFDYWIVKIDFSGSIQWQNTIGGSDKDYLISLPQTSDGGYILGGFSLSNISGDKTENSNGERDYWIVKINDTTITSVTLNIQHQNQLSISPNPFSDELTISTRQPTLKAEIKIKDIYGRLVYAQKLTTANHKLQTASWSNGIYFVEVITDEGREVKKIMKQ